ncbi:MAG: ion channel, partial [Chitinophagaceae bacterium]
MAKSTHHQKFQSVDNTGFSANSSVEGSRLINRDGNVNIRKTGIPFLNSFSIYHSLLRMKRWPFLVLVFAFYFVVNVIFALAFYGIGIQELAGATMHDTHMNQFLTAFFFSAQTLTTVGYGHISPVGLTASSLASFESLIGILAFALVTGIFYGRFSRPRAYLKFSDKFIIAPYRGGRAVMFRLATYKNNHLTDVEAQVSLALHIINDGARTTKFYPVKLEINKVVSLALSWTIVHPLNEDSPLYTFSEQDFLDNQVELMVNIKGFDDHFSNTVQQRTSYTNQEFVFGAKFLPMTDRKIDENYTVLHLDKIGEYERVELPPSHEVPASSAPVVA